VGFFIHLHDLAVWIECNLCILAQLFLWKSHRSSWSEFSTTFDAFDVKDPIESTHELRYWAFSSSMPIQIWYLSGSMSLQDWGTSSKWHHFTLGASCCESWIIPINRSHGDAFQTWNFMQCCDAWMILEKHIYQVTIWCNHSSNIEHWSLPFGEILHTS